MRIWALGFSIKRREDALMGLCVMKGYIVVIVIWTGM